MQRKHIKFSLIHNNMHNVNLYAMPELETWYCGFIIILGISYFIDFWGKDEEFYFF